MIIACLRCGINIPGKNQHVSIVRPSDDGAKHVEATNANDLKCPRCDTMHEIMIRAEWTEKKK